MCEITKKVTVPFKGNVSYQSYRSNGVIYMFSHKVNDKVICVEEYDGRYMSIGYVETVGQHEYTIISAANNSLGRWSYQDSWKKISKNTREMGQKDIVEGTKVLCICDSVRYLGEVGVVTDVPIPDGMNPPEFRVVFFGNEKTPFGARWTTSSLFRFYVLLEEEAFGEADLTIKKDPVQPIVVLSSSEKKPCPKCYYGTEKHTCSRGTDPRIVIARKVVLT